MYCIIKCIVQGKQALVKNADLRHPSCTVVMLKRKSASPVLNVLISKLPSISTRDVERESIQDSIQILICRQPLKFNFRL